LTDVCGIFCELVVSAHARSVVDVCRKLLLLPGKGVGLGVFVCDFMFFCGAHVVKLLRCVGIFEEDGW